MAYTAQSTLSMRVRCYLQTLKVSTWRIWRQHNIGNYAKRNNKPIGANPNSSQLFETKCNFVSSKSMEKKKHSAQFHRMCWQLEVLSLIHLLDSFVTDITAETALQNAKALVREFPDPGVPPHPVVFHGVTTTIIPFNNVQSCSFQLLHHLIMKITATTTANVAFFCQRHV